MLLHLLTWWLLCPHFCLSFSIPYNHVVLLSAVMSPCLWRSFTSVMSSPFQVLCSSSAYIYILPVNSLSCPLPVHCFLSLSLPLHPHPPTLCTWAMSVRCDNTHLWANHSPPPPPLAAVSLTPLHIPQLLTVICPSSGVSVTFLTSTFPLLLPWHLSMSSIKGGTSQHVLH